MRVIVQIGGSIGMLGACVPIGLGGSWVRGYTGRHWGYVAYPLGGILLLFGAACPGSWHSSCVVKPPTRGWPACSSWIWLVFSPRPPSSSVTRAGSSPAVTNQAARATQVTTAFGVTTVTLWRWRKNRRAKRIGVASDRLL